ncbi:MAG: tetratricopeptide repeat protein [Anaerolineales bacterium]|nr:tetratricopeptide repeat protein [Anaerolineales bacterium]
MSTPLLSTKFSLPLTGSKLVHRQRLWRILDDSLEQGVSLVLVCGPAGYGKTTLVSEWLQASQKVRPDQFAWLTLEHGDNDLTLFLTYFISALQRLRAGFGEGVLKMLQTHKPTPVPVLATLLINELNEFPGRIFLVLDDYHLITAEPIQVFLTFLLDHQPNRLCLVLLTRTDPPLPLARLRARRQLVELRQEALCFLADEVEAFANQSIDLALFPEQLAILARRTEGWISGLQLAAISMRAAPDRSAFFAAFSGEDRFIADYLTDDVLSGLSEPQRIFLLQTSILEHLSASLCEAVTSRPGAQAMLDGLVEANLFIVPLDNQRGWYRYHVLFADLLRKRLQEGAGGKTGELHVRASCWFEENGAIDLAIEHALAGQDFARAARLIEGIAEGLLMHGQALTLLRWLEALPHETILKRPVLGTLKGFSLILYGKPPEETASLYQELADSGSLDTLQGEGVTLQMLLAVLQGRSSDGIRLGEEALRRLPAERVFFRSLAADGLGMAYTLAGDVEAAVGAFEQVVEISTHSGNIMMTLMALTNLAGLRYVQGQMRLAVQTCRQVVDLASQRIGRQTPMLGKTMLNLGEMLREQGDLDSAEKYLGEAAGMMEFFSEIGLPLTWLALARIRTNRRDWPAAQAYIDQARQRAQASCSTLMDDRLVEVMQVRYWLARSDLNPALQWAHQLGLLDRPPSEIFAEAVRNASLNELFQAEYLTVVRLALAQGQPERALEMLSFMQDLVEKRSFQRRIIEILALKALALHQKGDLDRALQELARALALAEPEGYLRTFVDEGEPMARLLYQAVAAGISPGYAGRLVAVLAQESPEAPLAGKVPAGDLVEPLSRRELDVLGLIAEGLSNGEIASRLYISLSTVKGHTTNIFGKLGARNRTQAVARARSLGLLLSR